MAAQGGGTVLLILGSRKPAIGHCLPVILPVSSVVCPEQIGVSAKTNAGGLGGISVEEVLPPLLIRVAEQTHDVTAGMQIERPWFPHQLHAGFRRVAVPLFTIAGMAAGHQVFPTRVTATGTWNYMIQC